MYLIADIALAETHSTAGDSVGVQQSSPFLPWVTQSYKTGGPLLMRDPDSLEERRNRRIQNQMCDLLLAYLVALSCARGKMEEAANVVVLV